MVYVPLQDLLDKTNNSIYKLVILAAKRALEIAEGQPKLIDVPSSVKPSTIAMFEIAAGLVQYKISKPTN